MWCLKAAVAYAVAVGLLAGSAVGVTARSEEGGFAAPVESTGVWAFGPQIRSFAPEAGPGAARSRDGAFKLGILSMMSEGTRAQSGPSRVMGPDFDGDGFADLAIGAPFADVKRKNAGAVHVIYGSGSGLDAKRRQVWSQASRGIQDKPEWGDQFGWSIGTGDFDGDGYTDLAVGVRWERRNSRKAGTVHVLYGSSTGLTADRAQLWSQNSPGIRDRAERGDEFGWSLAADDFDGDGRDDLAIGVHHEDRGARDSGAVHILYGAPGGLAAAGNQVWYQGSPGIAGRPEADDQFGRTLAAGDFDGDGFADLAIGAPYEDRHVDRVGVVHILHGSRKGLRARRSQIWHQDSPGIRERAELRDQFGQSLSAADFDGDGFDDLAVGVWFEDYRNALSNEGGFHIIYGSRTGLRAKGNQFWNQDSPGTKDRTHISDRFSQTLAAADFDGDGFDDLAVGSPSADLRPGTHENRGAVHVFRGSRRGLTAKGDRYLTQDSPGVAGRSQRLDHFGASLGGADFDGDGYADLAVGIPWEDLRSRDDGAVYVIHGSRRGLRPARDRLWSAAGSGLPRSQRRGARFGWSLSSERPAAETPRTASPRT